MIREVFPEEIAIMLFVYAVRHIALAKHCGKKLDQEKWDRLVGKVCFPKLTDVIARRIQADSDNYYRWILDNC